MPELTTEIIREYLKPLQGREVTLTAIRNDLKIDKESKAWNAVRTILFQLAEQKVVRPSGKRDGLWKVVTIAVPVPVFSVQRERRPPFPLVFPKDFDSMMELPIANHVIVREGDLILIGGVSNFGKTTLSMNFLGENIDFHPILLGNEFTKDDEPTPRFLNRLDAMGWVEWTNSDHADKFTLLPVYEDFAENVVRDRINIIDWVNLDDEAYKIGRVMGQIKRAIGNGIGIIVLQKGEHAEAARGGQFTKDFADLELLIDKHGNFESRLTVGKCKESNGPLTGRSWVYGIEQGVKIHNVREVKKCWTCKGTGVGKGGECFSCKGTGWKNAVDGEDY